VFARKDLNFSLMSERDKRQIVAEVNILKDLSALVKRSAREADRAGLPPRGLDEDKVWNILMQLLKALVYCHHPNATGSASSSSSHSSGHHRTLSAGSDGEIKRPQILHRDIKPDNGGLVSSSSSSSSSSRIFG
jgi:NIMA (never in mitosis gene a)-related kinase 2